MARAVECWRALAVVWEVTAATSDTEKSLAVSCLTASLF